MTRSRIALAVLAAMSLSIVAQPADAKARRGASGPQAIVTCDLRGCSDRPTFGQITPKTRSQAASRSAKARRTVDGGGRSRKAHQRPPQGESGPGIVRSAKTGATARVDPAHAAKFQSYIDDLEQSYGARILFMGGARAGRCGLANQHACRQAIDICQLRWGVVDRRCNLPDRKTLSRVARAHQLWEGADWCRPDTGHAQVRFSGTCSRNLYSAVSDFKERAAGKRLGL